MNILITLFGEGSNLNTLQMCCRGFVVFFITLAFIRISGRRTFGSHSAFDNVITVVFGAIMGRAAIGASPFIPTVACSLLLVVLHRALAWLSVKYDRIGRLIKGNKIMLYENGQINYKSLGRSLISEKDMMANVRLKANEISLDDIDQIIMERSGEVSVIKKKAQQ